MHALISVKVTFALPPNKILNFCALLSNVHAKLPASKVCILCLKNMHENVNKKHRINMLKNKIHDKMILAFFMHGSNANNNHGKLRIG